MTILDAIVLGLVQGLTEFLPVSSTAHLVFACRWLGLSQARSPEQITAIVTVVQLGTLAAVIAWFARDLGGIAAACLRPRDPKSREPLRLLGWMVLGTLPIGVLGLVFKKFIEGEWTKNLLVIAGSLALWSVVLAVADRFGKRQREAEAVGPGDVLTVGVFQVFALVPGASRSGTTISGALFRGLTREAAARLSFLLSIPAIGAAGVLQLRKAVVILDRADLGMLALATGVAAVAGYASIAWLLRFLRTRSTLAFVIYRLALAALLAGMVLGGRWAA